MTSGTADDFAEGLTAELAALVDALDGIEDRLVNGARRVAEADGRLDREIDRLEHDVASAIQTLRDDVAAAVGDVKATVDRRLAGLALIPELREELLERIGALEAEVAALRDGKARAAD